MSRAWFEEAYRRIGRYVRETDDVLEIGCRYDRAVTACETFKCRSFTGIDARPDRVAAAEVAACGRGRWFVADLFCDALPEADVVISTAVLHHHPRDKAEDALTRMAAAARRTVVVCGPNAEKQVELYGDHRWHLERSLISEIVERHGWRAEFETWDDCAPPVRFFGRDRAMTMVRDGVLAAYLCIDI